MAVLAIVSSLLVVINSPTANAQPTSARIDMVDWEVGDILSNDSQGRTRAANAYQAMLANLGRYAGGAYANNGQTWMTTGRPNEVLEVRILRGGAHTASIYLWARNLYVFGFWAPNGGHRFFNDPANNVAPGIMGIQNPPRLPWDGTYGHTPGGNHRPELTFGRDRIHGAIRALENMGTALNGSNQQRTAFGEEMTRLLQIVPEALRFGEIADRITGIIRNGQQGEQVTLSPDLIELENSWARIGAFVYGWINNGWANQLQLRGRFFHTMPQLLAALHFVMIRHPNREGGS
jgi:hypothetical protein